MSQGKGGGRNGAGIPEVTRRWKRIFPRGDVRLVWKGNKAGEGGSAPEGGVRSRDAVLLPLGGGELERFAATYPGQIRNRGKTTQGQQPT